MKKLLTVLLVVLYFPSIFVRFFAGEDQLFVIIIPMIVAFILSCVNIVYAIVKNKSLRSNLKKQQSVNRTILITKLIAIPFFVLNFFIWSLLMGMLLLTPGGIIVDIILVPVAVGFTYAVLLATSSYSISLLFALYKDGTLSLKQFILHSILQLFFIVDIIDQLIIRKFTKARA